MSCEIRFNNRNERIGVYDKNGNPSKLFDNILSLPFVQSFDEAVDSYASITDLKDNTPLTFNEYDSYERALKASKGENIIVKAADKKLLK